MSHVCGVLIHLHLFLQFKKMFSFFALSYVSFHPDVDSALVVITFFWIFVPEDFFSIRGFALVVVYFFWNFSSLMWILRW